MILAEQLSKQTKDKLRKRQSLNYPQGINYNFYFFMTKPVFYLVGTLFLTVFYIHIAPFR